MSATCAIDGCDGIHFGRGWCMKHYTRWRRHGDPLVDKGLLSTTPEERFWARVDQTDSCWLWTGPLTANGYADVTIGRRRMRAHRFAYELLVGPIPDGLQLDHVKARGCRHRHCVNPAHLEPVTQTENILRGNSPAAIHARKTHCINGHEFSPENTYHRPDNGGRQCRTCISDRQRRSNQRSA
jgi:hypothetical protein